MSRGTGTDWRDLLYRKLRCSASLTEADFACTGKIAHSCRLIETDRNVREAPGAVGVLASGGCYRYRLLEDGRRVIFNVWLPGDMMQLTPAAAGPGMSIAAWERAEMIVIDGLHYRDICARSPALAAAFAASERLDFRLLASQVIRLARLTAYERVSHFLLEVWDRLNIVGLVPDGRIPFPLPQTLLADALGLTSVHISRTLKRLRIDGWIESHQHTLRLSDVAALADLCEYEWITPAARNRSLAAPRPSAGGTGTR